MIGQRSVCVCVCVLPSTGRAGPSEGLDKDMLPGMLRATISTYFPALWEAHGGDQLAQQFPEGNEAGWHPLYRDWMVEVRRTACALPYEVTKFMFSLCVLCESFIFCSTVSALQYVGHQSLHPVCGALCMYKAEGEACIEYA
jgi:hypothetical protein